MSERKNFRVSVGGYHKNDVMNYIDKLTSDAKAAEYRCQSLLSSVRQENTRLISRIGELETRLGTLELRLAEEQRRADALEQQASVLMGDLTRCRTAFEQNRQRAKRLSNAFESSARENQALRESLMYAERENERLEQMRRRLAAILLEPDAAGYTAPLSVIRDHARSDEQNRAIGLDQNDLEEMNQDLDELGESIANRLADIDGFINATAKVRREDSTVMTQEHADEFSHKAVPQPDPQAPVQRQPDVDNAYDIDLSPLDSQDVRKAARSGFTPPANNNHTQKRHAPPMVEKRWQRLGFVVRRGRDDEDYVEENRSADPLFSAPIWSDDTPGQG